MWKEPSFFQLYHEKQLKIPSSFSHISVISICYLPLLLRQWWTWKGLNRLSCCYLFKFLYKALQHGYSLNALQQKECKKIHFSGNGLYIGVHFRMSLHIFYAQRRRWVTLWGLGSCCEGAVMRCLSLEGNGLAFLYLSSAGCPSMPTSTTNCQTKGHHMQGLRQGLSNQMILKLSDKRQVWIGERSILKYSGILLEIFPLIWPTRSREQQADVTKGNKILTIQQST